MTFKPFPYKLHPRERRARGGDDFNSNAQAFLQYQAATRRLVPDSVELYRKHLRQFARYLMFAELDPRNVLPGDVDRFLAWRTGHGCAENTIHKDYAVLHTFYGWASNRGLVAANPMRDLKPPIVHDKPRLFLAKDQITTLVDSPIKLGRLHAHRDQAILGVLYYALLRVKEACKLKIKDVDFDEAVVRVLGKGQRFRVTPISPELGAILRRWLRVRAKDYPATDWLFPALARHSTTVRGHVGTYRVQLLIRTRYAPAAGLPKGVTPHTLRRSAADAMRRAGADMRSIQHALGHKKLDTTMVYLGPSPEEIRGWIGKI